MAVLCLGQMEADARRVQTFALSVVSQHVMRRKEEERCVTSQLPLGEDQQSMDAHMHQVRQNER